jgi:hypothetical protein
MRNPAARAASIIFLEVLNIPVESIHSLTAPWSFPPSVVKSFWYSINTRALSEDSREKSAILKKVYRY